MEGGSGHAGCARLSRAELARSAVCSGVRARGDVPARESCSLAGGTISRRSHALAHCAAHSRFCHSGYVRALNPILSEAAFELYARMHAAHWGRDALLATPWLRGAAWARGEGEASWQAGHAASSLDLPLSSHDLSRPLPDLALAGRDAPGLGRVGRAVRGPRKRPLLHRVVRPPGGVARRQLRQGQLGGLSSEAGGAALSRSCTATATRTTRCSSRRAARARTSRRASASSTSKQCQSGARTLDLQ